MPKLGTVVLKGLTVKPAASMVLIMHQNEFRAIRGEVVWTTTAESGFSFCFKKIVKARRVKFAQSKIVRVGKINDCHVKRFGFGLIEPDESVVVDYFDATVFERVFVEFAERGNRF